MSKRSVSSPVLIWNRSDDRLEEQITPRESFLRWSYESNSGSFFRKYLFTRPFFSWITGSIANMSWSRKKITPFVEKYSIQLDEYEPKEYSNFNQFFIRRFKPGARTFIQESNIMPAFSEGSYIGFEKVDADILYPVKGAYLSPRMILGDRPHSKWFMGGPLLISRLFPNDYHRFHYPDSGWTLEEYSINGALHSVNPVVLKYQPNLFGINERRISILKTKNFGRLAYIEVGATLVGRIVHTHSQKATFERGTEKGYFLVGGSTIILMGEPGAWIPSVDILEQTHLRRETRIKLGQEIARLQ